MSYQFLNKALASHTSGSALPNLPEPYLRIFTRLREEVRVHNFGVAIAGDSTNVGVHQRNAAEVEPLVDWAREILTFTYELELSTPQLILDQQAADGESPMDSLMSLFETWREYAEVNEGPFVSLSMYPSSIIKLEPFATVGNLCAAVGLAVLDTLPSKPGFGWSESAMKRMGTAWELALLARSSNAVDIALHFERQPLAA